MPKTRPVKKDHWSRRPPRSEAFEEERRPPWALRGMLLFTAVLCLCGLGEGFFE